MELEKMNPKQVLNELDKFDDENEEDIKKAIEFVEDYTDLKVNNWSLLDYFENHGITTSEGALDVLGKILDNGEITQRDRGTIAISLDMKDVKETYQHVKNSPVEYWNIKESYILCDPVNIMDLVDAIDDLFELD